MTSVHPPGLDGWRSTARAEVPDTLTSYGENMHRTATMATQTANPFAFGEPITLDNLDALFSHHRRLTGGWSMEGEGGDGGGGGAGGGAGGDGAGKGGDAPPKFEAITSQEQLDKVLGARLAREREKYSDYEDLVKIKAERDAAAEAAKTEAEKAVDATRKEGETTATERANERIVRSEAKAAAATAKFRDPDVAVKLLDLKGIKLDDNGEVDAAALKAELDQLATDHPYLVDDGKTTKPSPQPDRSQGGGGGGGQEKPGSVAEARQRAREAREARTRTKTA
jgi:hypothetical protein